MKKLLFCISIIWLGFLVLSCASAPAPAPEAEPQAVQEPEEKEIEFTQEHANAAFEEVYETHQSILILTGAQNYTVVKNDTPSKIATKFYGRGNGYFFPLIILASNDVILDPDLIEPGMILVVPDLELNLANEEARKGIRAFLLDIAVVYSRKTTRWAPSTQRELIKLADSL